MTRQTENAVRALCGADATIDGETLKRAVNVLKGRDVAAVERVPHDRLLSRDETAKRLNRSKKTVDRLCRAGLLIRATFGNMGRASGILESSVDGLLAEARARAVGVEGVENDSN